MYTQTVIEPCDVILLTNKNAETWRNLRVMMLIEEASLKRPQTVGFHLRQLKKQKHGAREWISSC